MVTRKSLIWFPLMFIAFAYGQDAIPSDIDDRIGDLEFVHHADPSDFDNLDALAGSYALVSRYNDAIPVVREMLAVKREDPALLLRLGQLYAWAGNNEESLKTLSNPLLSRNLEATAFRCDVLSGIPRPTEAAMCFNQLAGMASGDRKVLGEALLGKARNQLWSKNEGAGHSYEEYLKISPSDSVATLEYVQLLEWQGKYDKAEKLCDRILQDDSNNAEVLARRAEVLFWAGNRGWEAKRNADKAIDLAPALPAARVARVAALESLGLNYAASQEVQRVPDSSSENDMRSFLENRLSEVTGAHTDVPFSVYNDSDGIHDTMYQTSIEVPFRGDHEVGVNLAQYYSSAPTGVFTDGRDRSSVREFSISGTALAIPGVRLSLAGGGSSRSGESSLRPTYNATISTSLWDRWTVSLGSEREFLKVTPRSIDQDVSSVNGFVDIRYWINSKTSAEIKLDRRWWSDYNRSYQGDATLTRNLFRHGNFHLDGGALTSHESFSRDMVADSGFFTPDHYSRYDGFFETHAEFGKLIAEVRGEAGTQQILNAAAYQANWGITSRVSWKVGTAKLYGSYERRNYNLLAQSGWYQGFYLSLSIQR